MGEKVPSFQIIAENDNWLVVNKSSHLLTHPSKPGHIHSLLSELEQLLVFELATGGAISIMNRLDRETSGLVLVAKNAETASLLGEAKKTQEFEKIYLAVVHGEPEIDEFIVEAPICRKIDVTESEINIRRMVHESGKESRSDFLVLERVAGFSLLKCWLKTGRTHQLRVHLEHIGHPIVGDKIYGHDGSPYLEFIETGWTANLHKQLLIDRHALHATGLKWGNHHWQAKLPQDLREFLKKKGAKRQTLL